MPRLRNAAAKGRQNLGQLVWANKVIPISGEISDSIDIRTLYRLALSANRLSRSIIWKPQFRLGLHQRRSLRIRLLQGTREIPPIHPYTANCGRFRSTNLLILMGLGFC
jgi:hypothetical protein